MHHFALTPSISRSKLHVRHWVQWAVRQFNLPNIKLSDWDFNGKELYNLTIHDFQKIVPNDPGDIFWTHLELLRKMKVVGKKTKCYLLCILGNFKKNFNKNIKISSLRLR